MQRRTLGAVGLVGVSTLAVLLLPEQEVDEEEQVRRVVVQMTEAAQRRNVRDVLASVSELFKGESVSDKSALRQLVSYQILRGQWIRVFTTDLVVKPEANGNVRVWAKCIFARSDAVELKELVRQSVMSTYLIEAVAHQEPDGKWRFVWARHEEISPASAF